MAWKHFFECIVYCRQCCCLFTFFDLHQYVLPVFSVSISGSMFFSEA